MRTRSATADPPGDMGKHGRAAAIKGPLYRQLRLRKDTARPLYQQLEEQLTSLIKQGRIAAGVALPAERQLAEALGVSRATVQNCYAALRDRQLIRGHGRHGSIVQANGSEVQPGMDRLKGFTQEMRDLGREPSTKLLERQIVSDGPIAALFALGADARFLKMVRIRLGDAVPMSFETAWYSLDAAPSLDQCDPMGSVYSHLSDHGVKLAYCDQTIEAAVPTQAQCSIFGFERAEPCLLIKRKSHFRDGTMVEYVEGLFRGDLYRYKLRLDA